MLLHEAVGTAEVLFPYTWRSIQRSLWGKEAISQEILRFNSSFKKINRNLLVDNKEKGILD